MNSRLDSLLLAFILLAVPVVLAIEQFIDATWLTKFVTGILIGLTIVAGIIYTYRIAAESSQKR